MDEVWEYVQEVMRVHWFTMHYHKRRHLTKEQTIGLYHGLRGKRWQDVPVQFIINGPVVISVWYRDEDAISLTRK